MSKKRSCPSGRYFRMKKDIWVEEFSLIWSGLTENKIYEVLGECDFQDDNDWYYQCFGDLIEKMPVVTLEEYLLEICRDLEDDDDGKG